MGSDTAWQGVRVWFLRTRYFLNTDESCGSDYEDEQGNVVASLGGRSLLGDKRHDTLVQVGVEYSHRKMWMPFRQNGSRRLFKASLFQVADVQLVERENRTGGVVGKRLLCLLFSRLIRMLAHLARVTFLFVAFSFSSWCDILFQSYAAPDWTWNDARDRVAATVMALVRSTSSTRTSICSGV